MVLAALAVGLAMSVPVGANAASVAASSAVTPKVEICGQDAAVVRPTSMILTCADDGEVATHLHWSNWTAARATATGTLIWRACTSLCADSRRWSHTSASLALTSPVTENGKGVLFTRLTLHVTGPTPRGFMRDVAFDEAPTGLAAPQQSGMQATPSAAPSGSLGYAAIEGFWIIAGGPNGSAGSYTDAQVAAAITGAESSYLPGIIQPGVDYCGAKADRAGWGLWQITCGNSVPQYGTDFQVLDPWNNAEAAVYKCKQDVAAGFNCFTPWSTYTSGTYAQNLQHTTPDTNLTDPGQYVQINSTPPGTPSSPAPDPGSTYGPPMNSRATNPSIAAVAGSGYVEAFQNPQGFLCNRTESGVSNCTNLPMMAATSPSITGLAGGGYVEAYQNPQGFLCNRLETGTQACTNLQMAPGTSPSIAGTADGGYTEAFQASTGILWNRNNNGTAATTSLGMDPGSSPSISALAGGGYVEAFQNPQHDLCNRLETGTWACTSLGMTPGTSPSIAGTTNGGYTEAFQASTGILWNRNNNGTAATTSLGMDQRSSPSISALTGGGYAEAFQNPQHDLCNRLETGTWACTGLGMMAGTSPSIAGTADGGYTEAFQANTGILWNRNAAGTAASTGLGMM